MKKWTLVFLFLLFPTLAIAHNHKDEEQDTDGVEKSASEYSRLSVDKLWQMQRVGSPLISPLGEQVVVPVTSYDLKTDKPETRLWLLSTDGKLQQALTAAGQSASSPVFSPDGKHLAFVAKRSDDDAGQIYLLPMEGPGEATRLSEVPTGVSSLKWVAKHIYFISSVWPDKDWEGMEKKIKEENDSHVSAKQWNALPYSSWDRYLDENRQSHLYRIRVSDSAVEPLSLPLALQLTRSGSGLSSYDVHPDESHIVISVDSDPTAVDPKTELLLVTLSDGSIVNLSKDNPASDGTPTFSPNGNTLAFARQSIHGFYADTARLILKDLNSGTEKNMTAQWDRSITNMIWAPDNSGLYAAIADAGTVRVYFISARNGKPRAITDDTSFGGLSIANDGTLVGMNQSFLYPPRVQKINTRNGKTQRLDKFNDEVLASVEMGTYESVTYKGHNGKDIQMWVHYPPGFDSSKKYPLFLLIHGGPHNMIPDGFHFRWNAQTFASWGYVTAWHNFHGSNGFGQDFADAINPDWISAPYADTIGAAQWFAEKDWIDESRMVAGGGSYGGYLSSILLGKEHPFKALLIHAPVYNMYSQMAADFSVHSTRFGQYWDNPEIYKAISPHYFAKDFDTPALIIHGQTDLRVPVGQAFELFRTLQSKGIESRLIYYPDENHWVLKPNNSIYWYNEVQDWMAKFAEPTL